MRQNPEAKAKQLLLANYEAYYRLAFSYMGNESDALDVVQESAYKIIRDAGSVRDPNLLPTWIWRVIMNTALDFLRKRKKEIVGLENIEEPSDPAAEQDFFRVDTLTKDPLRLLASLSAADKTIVILKVLENRKLEEISEIMNMNVNTIKARLYRALKKLRIELEPEFAGKGDYYDRKQKQ
ncbi:MAG: RNA polymerase sigma factor [Enterocloster sp.]